MSSSLVHQHKDLESLLEAVHEQGKQPEKKVSRKEKRSAWLDKSGLDDEERALIEGLTDLIGSGVSLSEPRELEPEEVAELMSEAKDIRSVQDILDGRYQSIRKTMFLHFDAAEGENKPGEAESEQHDGLKFYRQITGGKPFVDWGALESMLPKEVWEQVTDLVVTTTKRYDHTGKLVDEDQSRVREPNEERVLAAIDNGTISMEHLASATERTKQVPRFGIK